MDSKLILGLIKEVVKNEVKQQVKEELAKLVKSGAVTLNKKTEQAPLMEVMQAVTTSTTKQTLNPIKQKTQPIREYSKNPILNEVLNNTLPFSNDQRVEGGFMSTSVLDSIIGKETDDEWKTVQFNSDSIVNQRLNTTEESTGNAALDAVTRALNRNYKDLVNHPKFKK